MESLNASQKQDLSFVLACTYCTVDVQQWGRLTEQMPGPQAGRHQDILGSVCFFGDASDLFFFFIILETYFH